VPLAIVSPAGAQYLWLLILLRPRIVRLYRAVRRRRG
jgi:hypothetical protein